MLRATTRAFLVDLEKMYLFDPESGVNLASKGASANSG